ncbi:NifK, partial [mine drainage metagenome]
IAVSTTCMAEVIGDDLNAFIKTSKEKGSVPEEYDVPFAHTPAFVGSHITGYDNALKGIMEHFWAKKERTENETINIVMGFDGYAVGNIRELKRVLKEMGIKAIIL